MSQTKYEAVAPNNIDTNYYLYLTYKLQLVNYYIYSITDVVDTTQTGSIYRNCISNGSIPPDWVLNSNTRVLFPELKLTARVKQQIVDNLNGNEDLYEKMGMGTVNGNHMIPLNIILSKPTLLNILTEVKRNLVQDLTTFCEEHNYEYPSDIIKKSPQPISDLFEYLKKLRYVQESFNLSY